MNLRFLVLITEMRERGKLRILLYYPRGLEASHQSFRNRDGVFSACGLFISD